MITASDEPGPSTSHPKEVNTPKFDGRYFDEKVCYARPRGPSGCAMEFCRTLIPVEDSPLSPPPHEKGPTTETPLIQPVSGTIRDSFHMQVSKPYDNVSEKEGR